MSKPAAIFVAAAMAVTAGCVAVIASFGFGLSLAQALLAAFGALVAMAVIQLAFTRAAPQDGGRLEDLDRVVTQLQSRIETLEARISTLDGAASERARAATKPMVEEIAALGGLVNTIAKELAAQDVEIGRLKSAAAAQAAPPASAVTVAPPTVASRLPPEPPAASPAPLVAPRVQAAPEAFDPVDALSTAGPVPTDDVATRLDRALASGRIEPHLQPIVTLPGRRVAHYEALARIVEPTGVLAAADFREIAAARGRIAEIDRLMLQACAPVAQRLSAKGAGAVFLNIAIETLAAPEGRAGIAAQLEGRPDIARNVVLELPQSAFGRLAGEGAALLDRLRGQGLRFSMDAVEDLRLDPRELSRRGVRFVKVAAERLLDPETARGAAIHPADLASLLSRYDIELVATHVEEERTVPELLDMDVQLSQGALFGVPRPVRPAAPDEAPSARPAAATRLVPRSIGAR